ncbi:MAG: LEPR-XLL domain-containing protein [Phycisphaera sp.]|nr:LEPR-XLL domain-containing protein [Phycisphaera sp.]
MHRLSNADSSPNLFEQLEPRLLLSADFGDAPSPYPTLITENGAQHTVSSLTLGAAIDMESDGVHSANADADDLADSDDEDGVTFGPLMVGALDATVTVNVQGATATAASLLHFDGEDGSTIFTDEAGGTWTAAGGATISTTEPQFGSGSLRPGGSPTYIENTDTTALELPVTDPFTIDFWVKLDAFAGGQYLAGKSNPDAGRGFDIRANGQVLEVWGVNGWLSGYTFHSGSVLQLDTWQHIAVTADASNVYLFVDGNLESTTGRNINSQATDRGFRFGAQANFGGAVLNGNIDEFRFIEGQALWTSSFTPPAAPGVNQPAKLDAWIDFNGDGSWGGPGEQVFDSVDLANGDNVLTFDVPSWAKAGTTYARFRLSSAGDLAPKGAAADGEVEDYAVTIVSPAWATGVFGPPNTISATANGAFSVFAADVDGDGDMDVLSASQYDQTVAWYENDGAQNFTPHAISTAASTVLSVFAADVDGDGDMDVLSASTGDDRIAWYENDGAESFTAHTISASADGATSVFAADVDGDGDLDVLSASQFDGKIAWYENDGSEGFTDHTISTSADYAFSVFAADLDGDGDVDVLSASVADDKIAWYENDGAQNFTAHTISTSADGAFSVFAADVDGDGDLDVLSASLLDDKIAWYENLGFTLDIDNNGSTQPLTDGILAIRYLAGFTGSVLTSGAVGAGAMRSDPVDIFTYLDTAPRTVLDVDADGLVQPLTDGILIIRYLAGFTGTVLTNGATGSGATRTDPADIINFLDALQPPAGAPPLMIEQSPPAPAPLVADSVPRTDPAKPVRAVPDATVDLLAAASTLMRSEGAGLKPVYPSFTPNRSAPATVDTMNLYRSNGTRRVTTVVRVV